MFLRKTGALACVLVLMGALSATAHGADRGKATVTIGDKTVTIDYGRPNLANRDMLAKAEVGKSWRLGADAPTTLTTDLDLVSGTTPVPKGTYTLTATKTGENAWSLNLVRNATDRTSPQKVVDAPLEVGSLPASVEQLTIELQGSASPIALVVSWGKTSLKTTFTTR